MITDNLRDIQSHYKNTNPELIAVSKQQPDEKIDEALNAGLRIFGENRVQDAIERWIPRKPHYPDLKLHLIGPLQTNKVKQATELFDCIHTLDREKLAISINTHALNMPCFIQVNTGEEEQKNGITPSDLIDFHGFCTNDLNMHIIGLMCIPPKDESSRLHFGVLHKYAQKLNLPNLSMGMSGDYDIALKYGATHIRVGSKLFGERTK
jgi:pyridoxal phosphate enzyme (YggS family)